MADHRVIAIPEGLAGERVDAAMARLLGISRTRAAEMVADSQVRVDGHVPQKSDRVEAGALLEADIPAPRTAEVVAEPVEGVRIVFEDEDLIVVDKPSGVAAHPGAGWD